MGMIQIVWLILGIILCAAGFLIPEKQGKKETDTRMEEEKLRAFLEEEMKDVRKQIEGMAEEAAQYAVEKTERALERLTNEKMMAVNEYSDTVLKEINRNHEEVMFLYDMLNDKHVNLKNTVKEVTQSAKEAKETAQDARIAVDEAEEKAKRVMESVNEAAETGGERGIAPLEAPRVEATEKTVPKKKEKQTAAKASAKEQTGKVPAEGKKAAGEKPAGAVDIRFAEADDKANNNEKILKMHKAGKSNMAIAKELGLGIGEVKLVIDLFEGM